MSAALLSEDLVARLARLRPGDGETSLATAFESFLRRLAEKPETVGIALLGSLGGEPDRHPLDGASDLDLAVFLTADALPPWAPEFSFRLHVEGERLGPELNVYQNRMTLITPEACTVTYTAKYEALSSARVVWDRDGQVAGALERLLRSADVSLLLTNALHRSDRFLRRSAAKLVERRSLLAAHLLVNEAVGFLVQALFFLNGRFPPHTKWVEHDLGRLPWKPAGCLRRIRSALRVRSFSERELRRRVDEGLRLWDELFARGRDERWIVENYYQVLCTRYHKDRQILPAPLAVQAGKDALARGIRIESALLRGVVNTALCSGYADLAAWLEELAAPALEPLLGLARDGAVHLRSGS